MAPLGTVRADFIGGHTHGGALRDDDFGFGDQVGRDRDDFPDAVGAQRAAGRRALDAEGLADARGAAGLVDVVDVERGVRDGGVKKN